MYIPALAMFIGGTIVATGFHLWARQSEDEPEQPAGLSLPVTATLPFATSFVLFLFCFNKLSENLESMALLAIVLIILSSIAATFVGFRARNLISGLTIGGWGSLMGVTLAWVMSAHDVEFAPLWVNVLFFVCLALVGTQSLLGLFFGLWADHKVTDRQEEILI